MTIIEGCIGDDGVWRCSTCPMKLYTSYNECERYLSKNDRHSLAVEFLNQCDHLETSVEILKLIQHSMPLSELDMKNRLDQVIAKAQDLKNMLEPMTE